MGWFNEIVNKIKDFFGKEEDKEIDLSPYEESQNKLNEQLKQIDEEYKAEHSNEDLYEDIEDLLPEKIEFEYREYTGDDEKTMTKRQTKANSSPKSWRGSMPSLKNRCATLSLKKGSCVRP